MKTKKSDTPRTDALLDSIKHHKPFSKHINLVFHARKLEKEIERVNRFREGLYANHQKLRDTNAALRGLIESLHHPLKSK